MKFWELISAFRSEPVILDAFFSDHPNHEFSDHYASYDAIVTSQNRAILDSIVPYDLVCFVASRSTQTFLLSRDGMTLRSSNHALGGIPISAIDVVNQFGGSIIEEVHEKGSARVGG